MARTVTNPIPLIVPGAAPGLEVSAPDLPNGKSGASDYINAINSLIALNIPNLVADNGYLQTDKFLTHNDPMISYSGRRYRVKTPHRLDLPSGPHVSVYIDKIESGAGAFDVDVYLNGSYSSTLDLTIGASGATKVADITLDDTSDYNELRFLSKATNGTGHWARGLFVVPYLDWTALPSGAFRNDLVAGLAAPDTLHVAGQQAAPTWLMQHFAALLEHMWSRYVPTLGSSGRLFDATSGEIMISDIDLSAPPGVDTIEVHVYAQKATGAGSFLEVNGQVAGTLDSTPSTASGIGADGWYVFDVPVPNNQTERITLNANATRVESVMICCADAVA